ALVGNVQGLPPCCPHVPVRIVCPPPHCPNPNVPCCIPPSSVKP
ncbi:hypothetical protein A2U01_0095017, partial [Trifolium medium]|nr:hypothetical protein [Trifolium medium]